MPNIEKIKGLLDQIKNCPDADIRLYWAPMLQLFIPASKADSKECAMAFYKWAKENAGEQSLKFYYAESLMGTCYILSEEYELSLLMTSKARKSFEEIGYTEGVQICSLVMGVVYRTLGNFDLALKTLITPFEYFKKTGSYPVLMEGSCNSLGNVNLELHNYEEAFTIFSIGYEKGVKSGYFAIYCLDGMGKAKMMLNEPVEAKEYFDKALDIAEKIKNPPLIGNALTEKAIFDFRTGNLAEAERLNKQALTIREQENLYGAAITSCINLGQIYIKQSRWDEALRVLNKGLALAEQLKVKPKIYQVHSQLSKVYKGLGNMEQSLHHYEIFHELREKVQDEDNARKLTDAKLIFEAEQTKKENIIIKKQKQEIENKNRQLQETIDELTITKVSRKARGITLIVGIALIIAEDPIMAYVLRQIGEGHFWLGITAKIIIIFSLKPIDTAIEGYLLHRLILKKRKDLLEKRHKNTIGNQSVIISAEHNNNRR